MLNIRFTDHGLKPERYTDDAESLLSNSNMSSQTDSLVQRRPSMRLFAGLVTTHLLVALISVWLTWIWRLDPDSLCARLTSKYSPILKDVGISYKDVQYNGSFFHETIYRRDPSPEVDAAWTALGVDYRPLRLPESEAQQSGIALDQVKIKSKYGGGYPANVEGLHHLHCLNLLRQSLHYNYEYYKDLGHGAFKNEESIVKVHVTHCLDILRQQLMCTVDTGVLGQVWVSPSKPTTFVDFNTAHMCKNYDAIRQWAEERQLPEQSPNDFLEPPKAGDRIYAEIP